LNWLLWFAFAFLCGALPLALWLGKAALGVDIRQYGDGNPGATNVFRAGGRAVGALAIFLEALKGALPVALAFFVGRLQGWELVAVAAAPPLGHAFSPFLNFRGGKAVAVTGGVWIGLTLWEAPIIAAIAITFWFNVFAVSGWIVVFTTLSVLAFYSAIRPEPLYQAVAVVHLLLFFWTHRADLRLPPGSRWHKRRARRAAKVAAVTEPTP
jgi:glycerol-3-phosphate acyltransferase PlsY